MQRVGVAGAFRSIRSLSLPIFCPPAALVKRAGFFAGAVPGLQVEIIFFSTPTPTATAHSHLSGTIAAGSLSAISVKSKSVISLARQPSRLATGDASWIWPYWH
jgi:hypothetical protein